MVVVVVVVVMEVVVGVVVVVVVVMVIGATAAAAQRLMGTAAAAAVMGKCSMIGHRNVAMTVPAPGGPLPSRWRAALPPCHLGSKDQT